MKEDIVVRKQISAVLLFIVALLLLCACSKQQPAASTASLTWQEQYDLGMRYLSQGNYREAIIAFSAATEIDPKRYEAYIGLADAYLGLEDEDSAIDALREGYTATGDERLQRRVEEIQSSRGTGTGGQTTPYGDPMPPELTVLVSAEYMGHGFTIDRGILKGREAPSSYGTLINEYDKYGYLVFSQSTTLQDPETVATLSWEYDEAAGTWSYSLVEEYGSITNVSIDNMRPGTGMLVHIYTSGNLVTNPWIDELSATQPPTITRRLLLRDLLQSGEPMPDSRPTRVENPYNQTLEDDEGWTYAICEYDGNNNMIKVTSYNSSREIGYCTFEWAKLVLNPDGTYTMQ